MILLFVAQLDTNAQTCNITGPSTVDVLTDYQFICNAPTINGYSITSFEWSCNYLGTAGTINGQNSSFVIVASTSNSNTATIKWGIEDAPIATTVFCNINFINSNNNTINISCSHFVNIKGIPSSVHLNGPSSIQKCCTTAVTYTVVNYGDGNIFNWSIPSGWTVISGGSSSSTSVTVEPDYLSGGSVNCNVQVSTAPASYSRNTSILVSRPEPEIAAFVKTPIPCDGVQVTFITDSPCGIKDYIWDVPSGWTVVSQSGNQLTVIVKESATLSVNLEFWGGCYINYSEWIYVINTPPGNPKFKAQCPNTTDPDGCPLSANPRICVATGGGSITVIEPDYVTSYYVEVTSPWVINYQGIISSSNYILKDPDYDNINDIIIQLPNWQGSNSGVYNGVYRVQAINCVGNSDIAQIAFQRELDWWCLCPNYEECVCPPINNHPGYPCGHGPWRSEEERLNDNTLRVVIFPNPASNQLQIEGSDIINCIEICDLTGRVIKSETPLVRKTILDLNLNDGVYLVKLTLENIGTYMNKICIVK
jgi:hypothetical protein